MEIPPRKYRRLTPGGMVRLRYGYIVVCEQVVKDAAGEIEELHCRYVPESKSGSDMSGLKPKGVIHWVDTPRPPLPRRSACSNACSMSARPNPDDLLAALNRESLHVAQAMIEPAIVESDEQSFQFERKGYFIKDPRDYRAESPVFNRSVSLRDSYKPDAN